MSSSSPINVIKNPSTIVIYPEGKATENTAAIIEITRIVPSVKFKDKDPCVTWTITPLSARGAPGGGAAFLGGNTGPQVRAYGIAPGEILITAKYGNATAPFRAVVADLLQVKFRVNRLRTQNDEPEMLIADIRKHIRFANIYLRQAGIKIVPSEVTAVASATQNPTTAIAGDPGIEELSPDSKLQTTQNFPAISSNDDLILEVKNAQKGYFEVLLDESKQDGNVRQPSRGARLVVTGGDEGNEEAAIRINAINEVINIAYCKDLSGSNPHIAACWLLPVNHGQLVAKGWPRPKLAPDVVWGRQKVTDKGTPSTSWVHPNGLAAGSFPLPALPAPTDPSWEKYPRPSALATRDGSGADPSGPEEEVKMLLLPPLFDWSSPYYLWLKNNARSHAQNLVHDYHYYVDHSQQTDKAVTRKRGLQWGLAVSGKHNDPLFAKDLGPATSPHERQREEEAKARSYQIYGRTIAYEICHLFGLRHRGNPDGGGSSNDLVLWPKWENLMCDHPPNLGCENLDIIQSRAIRFSELFYWPNAIDTSPETEP